MPDQDENKNDELDIVEEDGGSEAEGKIKKIKVELKDCRKKTEEYLAGWQRAKADLINARKDEEKFREEIVKYANGKIIYELLNVLDSLGEALNSTDLEEKWKTGFGRIYSQLLQIMRGYGLKEIEALGQRFNPEEHESVSVEEVAESDKDQIILEEIQKGYKIHDKVIRPARVKIGAFQSKN